MTIPATIHLGKSAYQLPELDRSQLEVLKARCLADMRGMHAQLDRAQRRLKEERIPIKPDWFNRCSWALKKRGEALGAVQHYLEQAGPPDPNAMTLADHFMEEAEFVLEHEIWRQIYARAIAAHEEITGLRSDTVLEPADGP